MIKERDIPVVPSYHLPCGCQRFYCPFCREPHSHGQGGGHRSSHCFRPGSPWKATGYILVDAGPWTPELEASMRQFRRSRPLDQDA